jgi:curved DNA-binding protein CbpA
MKLFISYSRDDSAWTYEFWRKLREDTSHDAWIDQRIVPASDWWHSILEEIERSDCFVTVLTPKSVSSIYCLAELNYALSLNKPILPLMLKLCSVPEPLKNSRIQYQDITNSPPMDRVLVRTLQGLNYVEVSLTRGEYEPKTALRPVEPKPMFDATETIQIAEDAAAKGNYSLAESLLKHVIDSDKGILGEASKERLEEILRDRERGDEYQKIKTLLDNTISRKTGEKAWQRFIERYGSGYDPDNLSGLILVNAVNTSFKQINPNTQQKSPAQPKTEYSGDMPFNDILEQMFGNLGGKKRTDQSGFDRTAAMNDQDIEQPVKISLREAYTGTKRIITKGNRKMKTLIPAGADTGTRVRLAGEGRQGVNGGQLGDLYLIIEVETDNQFERKGHDLYTDIYIEGFASAVGGEIEVQTLDRTVKLTIPPGTESGHQFQVSGKGMPILRRPGEYGDLFVSIYYIKLHNTVGVETLGGVSTPLINKDTFLPIRHTQIFSTAADNQTQVELHLCYGEKPMASDNISLGKYIYDGIPQAPRGIPQIELGVAIDQNSILTVTAEDKATGMQRSFEPIDLTQIRIK